MTQYTIIKGPDSAGCAYAFWTGWPMAMHVLEQREPIQVVVTMMRRPDKDHVQLFGTVGDKRFEATLAISPHQAEHGTGSLLMVAE
jgi:hypothetical protein